MSELKWFRRDIIRPATEFEHEALRHVQRVLRMPVTGEMDDITIAALRGTQAVFGLRMTGILDKATAEEIENIRSYYSVAVSEAEEDD